MTFVLMINVTTRFSLVTQTPYVGKLKVISLTATKQTKVMYVIQECK